jgi:predicted DNA-binding protein
MPRKNSQTKPVHSFRLSYESLRQIKDLSTNMGRSEGDVVEIAIDRMYREEIRFGNLAISEGEKPENNYKVEKKEE